MRISLSPSGRATLCFVLCVILCLILDGLVMSLGCRLMAFNLPMSALRWVASG